MSGEFAVRTSLAACVALAIATMSASADDRPIKIGLLTALPDRALPPAPSPTGAVAAFQRNTAIRSWAEDPDHSTRHDRACAGCGSPSLRKELIVGGGRFHSRHGLHGEHDGHRALSTSAKVPVVIGQLRDVGHPRKTSYLARVGFRRPRSQKRSRRLRRKNGMKNVYTFIHEFGPGLDAEVRHVHPGIQRPPAAISQVRCARP